MKVKFLGAARTVTGSCYVLEQGGARFAVDCGMHQGNKDIERRNLDTAVYDPKKIDFFLITHAHIDHSGLLPRMFAKGFHGPIYATAPTRDLLEIMLLDSAHIQEMEAQWQNKGNLRRAGKKVEPLYDTASAKAVLPLIQVVEYGKEFSPAPGLRVTYKDAGHILGSAFIELCFDENGSSFKALFSGDLGRSNQLLMRDPSLAFEADYLFLESTYGDRDHKDESSSLQELSEAIKYCHANGEKVIIPAFAVERTQELLYSLHMLAKQGQLPADMPVFLDSPLAIQATEIFKRYPKYLDSDTNVILQNGEDPLSVPGLRYSQTTEESRSINEYKGPAIVISASGMCNAGRIKHHLRHNLWRKGAAVVFVGYQGVGTPGRKIVDGAKSIRILGEEVAVEAKVFTIGGFSAHAGQSQILSWVENFQTKKPEVFLVHGENTSIETLAVILRQRFGLKVYVPDYLEELTLKAGIETKAVSYPEKARPQIDWSWIVGDAEGKLAELKARMGAVAAKPWAEQTELRDRFLDLSREMSKMLSEIAP